LHNPCVKYPRKAWNETQLLLRCRWGKPTSVCFHYFYFQQIYNFQDAHSTSICADACTLFSHPLAILFLAIQQLVWCALSMDSLIVRYLSNNSEIPTTWRVAFHGIRLLNHMFSCYFTACMHNSASFFSCFIAQTIFLIVKCVKVKMCHQCVYLGWVNGQWKMECRQKQKSGIMDPEPEKDLVHSSIVQQLGTIYNNHWPNYMHIWLII